MTGDAGLAVQRAIFDRLAADAELSGLVSGLFDHVPEESSFPYVVLGEGTAVDWSAKDIDGQRHTLVLHVWSRARGRSEAKSIMGRLYDLLHRADLILVGHKLVILRFDFSETLREVDGLTYHGVMRFRALTQALA